METGDADARIAQLFRLARGLEDDGHYNLGKLFRAAALGRAYRASLDRPRFGAGLEEAVEAALAALRAEGGDAALLGALERSWAAVRAGGFVTLAEAPATRVCRDCGAVLLGEPPAACPGCGARALGFQEIPPAYYFDPLEIEPLLAALAETVAEVERLTAGVSPAEAERGPWPMRAIVAHLLAAERLLVGRVERTLAEDNPLLASVSPPQGDLDADLPTLVAHFRAARARTLARLRALSAEQWQRRGDHPEWGRRGVLEQMTRVARHEHGHLAELAARRAGR